MEPMRKPSRPRVGHDPAVASYSHEGLTRMFWPNQADPSIFLPELSMSDWE